VGVIRVNAKKIIKLTLKIAKKYYLSFMTLIMLFLSNAAFADNNPFPDIDIGSGDVVDIAGKKMQLALKYTLMGVGGVLVLIGIMTLINRLREDNRDKEHGNLLMSMIMIALCLVVGFILIAIGWKAFSQNIQG
jgi:hypothetical protein